MKNINKISITFLALLAAIFLYAHFKNKPLKNQVATQSDQNANFNQSLTMPKETIAVQKDFVHPIDGALKRITKKPFGIFITPQNSPVQPERFFGYHTGTDFETDALEENADVPIYAITNGKIIDRRWVSGYGGALVESAEYNGNLITIVYGHLNLGSIDKKTGDSLIAGEKIGILGRGYSQETDGERKHLHLGICKGMGINVKGYVDNKTQLSDWIDSLSILNF